MKIKNIFTIVCLTMFLFACHSKEAELENAKKQEAIVQMKKAGVPNDVIHDATDKDAESARRAYNDKLFCSNFPNSADCKKK
jgi:hypothetical protein